MLVSFFDISAVIAGLETLFQPVTLLWLVVGVLLGLAGGTLPGISGATLLAVILVFVLRLPLEAIVIAMAGIYAASVYAGSSTGILYNVPGDAAAIPSTIEGYAMTKRGESYKALVAAMSGSFYGAIFSALMLFILVPIFLYLVTFIGTGERALFALWALVLITSGALTKEDSLRGLASMAVGLFLGTVGMQRNIGAIRYIPNVFDLWDGINLLWLVLGIFAIPQIIQLPYVKITPQQDKISINPIPFFKMCFTMIRQHQWVLLRSAIAGTVVGVIPGIGAVTASWIGYAQAERASKNRETFGKGNYEGILGAETASNACVPGTFVPLMALGIPGSAVGAIIMGGFISAGVYPGPALMLNNGPVVWTILFGIGLSSFVFLLFGVPFIKLAQVMVSLPNEFLIALIGMLTMMGTFLARFNVFGALFTIALGLIVMLCTKFGLVPSAVLLGFVLGPVIEVEFIRAYQIGGFGRFLEPFSLVLVLLTIGTLGWSIYSNYATKKKASKAKSEEDAKREEMEERYFKKEEVKVGNYIQDIVFALFGFGLAAYIFISLRDISTLGRFWPYLIAGFFLGVPCALMLLRALIKVTPRQIGGTIRDAIPGIKQKLVSSRTLDFIVIMGGLVLTTYMIDILGFVGACGLYAFIILTFFGGIKRPIRIVIGTAAFTIAMWALRVAFSFPLPTGILGL